MNWDEYIKKKNSDAFRRMYIEVLLRVFNDILPLEMYQYYLSRFIHFNDARSKLKISLHNDAINWLLGDSGDNRLCFEVLGLQYKTRDQWLKAIYFKFNNPKKFLKFAESYAMEYGNLEEERKSFLKTKRELCPDDTKSKTTTKKYRRSKKPYSASTVIKAKKARRKNPPHHT